MGYLNLDRMNRMSTSSMETFFDSILRGKLTDNLFFEEMPPVIHESWDDFVVVDCMNPFRDHDAYGVGTVLIYLYAKQSPYGTKNVKRLAELERRLNQIILENDDPHYNIQRRGMYSNYNAVNDIFYNVIQLTTIIS